MTHDSSQRVHSWLHDTTHRTFSRGQKLLILAGVLIALATSWVSQRLLDAHPIKGYSASILQRGSTLRGAVAVAVAVVVGCMATMLLGRKIRPDIGLFCAALGLLYFRFQGSATRYALFNAAGRDGYLLLAVELALLAGLMVVAFMFLHYLVNINILDDDAAADGCTVEVEKFDQKLLCTATVAVVTTAAMMILCQSDRPGQTLWAVFIAAFVATWCAFRFIPVVPSMWYWSGPIITGLIGYLFTYQYGSVNAAIGQPSGMFAALARPMPLDYASVGVAGSLIGYWVGRKQARDRVEEADEVAARGSHKAAG